MNLAFRTECAFTNVTFNICASSIGHSANAMKRHVKTDMNILQLFLWISPAFDCLPRDILLSKLSAYGLRNESLQLLNSYLSGRKQQIKLNNIVSSWSVIKKGAPQGSILGPLLLIQDSSG